MKKGRFFVCLILVVVSLFSVCSVTASADSETVYLGGMPAGFSLYTRGAIVVGLCDVITDKGLKSPCKDCEIEVGDTILAIDDDEINNASDIEKALKDGKGKLLTVKRNGKIITELIYPAKDVNGIYKLGVFVKDSVSGIGTVTYIKGNRFASLGHPVTDEKGEILNIVGGNLYECNITGYVKGERGKPGELRGVFTRAEASAAIDKNLNCGVYGKISDKNYKQELIPVTVGEARMGDAAIYSTIDGTKPVKYSISIIKADESAESKNFVIKVTDKRLLETTGGIVQGMSGSPIVQDDKLVGAVTHVFINDPTRGFGISIAKMITN